MELDFSQVGTAQDPGERDMPAVSNTQFMPETELLPVVQTLSLEAVKPKFQEALERIRKIITEAGVIAVTDDDSLKYAVALVGEGKKMTKVIEKIRDKVIEEPKGFLNSVRSFSKGITDDLERAIKEADGKATQYRSMEEMRRLKAEQAAREAARKLQEELDRQAEEANRKLREEAARKAEEELRAKQAIEAAERAKKAKEEEGARIEREKREAEEIEAARKRAEEESRRHEIEAPKVTVPDIPAGKRNVRTDTGTTAYEVKTFKVRIINAALVPRWACEPSMKLLNDAVKKGVREIEGCEVFEDVQTRYRT
jgi:vacuolar-type H+-ATPase subunit I/STV1